MVLKKTNNWVRDRGWRRANPGLGKGNFDQDGGFWRKKPTKRNEDWGANCSVFPIVII